MTMKVTVIAYETQDSVEAERDDSRHHFELESFASPQFHRVVSEATDEVIEEVKAAVIEQLRWPYVDVDAELVDPDEDLDQSGFEWQDTGWIEPEHPGSRRHRRLTLVDNNDMRQAWPKGSGPDLPAETAMIVLQEVELDG